jgi:predicted transcriptional regulator
MLTPANQPPSPDTHSVTHAASGATLSCAQAILDICRRAGRPLSFLDILDELGHHYRGWTSSSVRHLLADLVERGLLQEHAELRPHAYTCGTEQPTAQPG